MRVDSAAAPDETVVNSLLARPARRLFDNSPASRVAHVGRHEAKASEIRDVIEDAVEEGRDP